METDELDELDELDTPEEPEEQEECAEPQPAPQAEAEPAPAAEHDALAAAATAQMRAQYDAEIAGMGITNPYTGKAFRNFAEFRAYGARFRHEQLAAEAQKQGKPIETVLEDAENRSFLARKRAEEQAQQQALEALAEQKAFIAADLRAFMQKYPAVDVVKLEQNPKFRKFAGKRLYREPLGALYGDFTELVSDAERMAVERATAKQGRSTGGAQGGGLEVLNAGQRSALEEWNRENPALQMTAKEFLGR